MHILSVRNVGQALEDGLPIILEHGKLRESRNGPVFVMDGPFTTVYTNPLERVMFWPERDANPYFHFMEGLWMLAGRCDVEWISRFNSNITSYSDDGATFHGAYGYRWRQYFGQDQLFKIAEMLKENPDDRRAVLQMWDVESDLGKTGKDFPCNLMICFRISINGFLDMTVYNRSNDAIWGAWGANAVHMSMLQELMASWIGVPIGRYWQVANNFHLYKNLLDKKPELLEVGGDDPYIQGMVKPFPMVNGDIGVWMQDLYMFVDEGPVIGFRDPFFKKVVIPMYQSYMAFKDREDPDRFKRADEYARNIKATDWQVACREWLDRRQG